MNRIPSNPISGVSLAGSLLVASPKLADPMFGKSVCLLVEQTPQGIAGVLLNRPVISDVGPLWQQLAEGSSKTAEPPRHLHFGGPVSGPVVAVHDQELLAEDEEGGGIYVAAQMETLKKLVYVSPDHYRLFVGHATWSLPKLQEELAQGLWYIVPAVPDLVFAADEEMWIRSIRRAGSLLMQHLTGAKHLPPDPQAN